LESGQTPGDRVSGVHYTVYKVRVRNTDVPKGKSGGYRVIYYMRTADNIVIVMMYSKSEREDVDADEIRRVIDNL
jgi:mRNA-degrading endonuclease RelE of RelBE toxin-antitoxin system